MLLIAQPKSASTSLMWSLSEIMKVPMKNGTNRKPGDIDCPGYKQLQTYHGTMVKRGPKYLKEYITNNILYKEHILPIKEHLEIIDNIGKSVVVLLRDPKECVASYRRVLGVIYDIKINYDEMEKELRLFNDTYSQLTNKDIYMIIGYNEIVNDFTNTIKKVLLHYGKNIPDDVEHYRLQKRNYTWSK